MEKILVLGAGHFGKKAVETFARHACKIVIVDRDPAALPSTAAGNIVPVCAEGIFYLATNDLSFFDWIIPALPVHMAFAWLRAKLEGEEGILAVPVPPGLHIPNNYYVADGTVYATLSRQLCPEDCPEPEGFCYLTGEARELPLYSQLEELHANGFITHVLRSHQLAPGIGGFTPLQLQKLLAQVAGHRLPGLVISSCACHAVINAFSWFSE
ncbi:MAG: hypothetical protein M1571_10085 [Firmicutes bacterium]|nr:hypothetical protein [Bacillota bacterium]